MATISEVTGVPLLQGIQFGVECEVEGRRLPMELEGVKWLVEHDGSLREGVEYVFSKPLNRKGTEKALTELFAEFVKRKTQLDYSFRTSTHVHVNVSDLEVKQVLNIVFLYTLVEDLFVKFCAPHRHGNRFCLRFKEAQNLYQQLGTVIRETVNGNEGFIGRGFDQNITKYAALNLYTLLKYGTLEFRSLEGTNDLDKIKLWLDAIENLVKVGQRFETISELHNEFFNDPEKIIDEIFTNPIFKFDGWTRSVEESYSQAFHLVLIDKGMF